MRGYDLPQSTMLTLVNPEQRVPAKHPIRLIKQLAEVALERTLAAVRADVQRSGPAVDSTRAVAEGLALDGAIHLRSERMFCEQLDYNLLFRWFLDLNWDEPGFDHSSFSRNRGRLLKRVDWRALQNKPTDASGQLEFSFPRQPQSDLSDRYPIKFRHLRQ